MIGCKEVDFDSDENTLTGNQLLFHWQSHKDGVPS